MFNFLTRLFYGVEANSYALIVWAVCIGLFAAVAATVYRKAVPGRFVRALLKAGADRPENARSLAETGCDSALRRYSLRPRGSLRRTVRAVRPSQPGGAVRFFIPAELASRAERQFDRRGANPVIIPVAALLFVAAALFVIYVGPELVTMAMNFLAKVKG